MSPHDDYESMLVRRMVPTPRHDLAERILFAASRLEQRHAPNLAEWLNRLFAEFHLPKPAYALAMMLTLGIAIGFGGAHLPLPETSHATLTFDENGAYL